MSSESTAPLAPDTSNYRKYQTKNPVMRAVINRFIRRVCAKVRKLGPRRIVDLGCGEGIVASELAGLGLEFEYLGLDLDPSSIQAARQLSAHYPSMRFEQSDILTAEPLERWADLVICLEVLEHLEYPAEAVERMMRWTASEALVSVPWEPWFRIGNFFRGKYPLRFGNHPEHIHQFKPRTLRGLLLDACQDVQIETCFPWIIGTARRLEKSDENQVV
jgi:SAM-dependent methyltransferase